MLLTNERRLTTIKHLADIAKNEVGKQTARGDHDESRRVAVEALTCIQVLATGSDEALALARPLIARFFR